METHPVLNISVQLKRSASSCPVTPGRLSLSSLYSLFLLVIIGNYFIASGLQSFTYVTDGHDMTTLSDIDLTFPPFIPPNSTNFYLDPLLTDLKNINDLLWTVVKHEND